jgi:hypothetical protein
VQRRVWRTVAGGVGSCVGGFLVVIVRDLRKCVVLLSVYW